jgi:hypothetical protein
MDKSSIVSQLSELTNINIEIKRMNVRLKEVRERKKIIEERILEFMKSQNATNAKTENLLITTKETIKRTRKPNDNKEKDVLKILESSGIMNPKHVYSTIVDAMKGNELTKQTLKIVNKK